jgi:HAD superfamily hydrolase (TIGR01549 family)
MKIPNIKIIIWDVDGTLYAPSIAMGKAVLESAYATIERRMGWPRYKVEEEFAKVHEKITLSQTEAVSIICGITTAEAARETDAHLNRSQFISRDEKLIALFRQLSGFSHYILGNGSHDLIIAGLDALGLDRNQFKEIVTSEIVGVNKPNDAGFRYIMQKTGLPPESHMMVGDRENVDLAPAKALGMHTCLVWSPKPSLVADVTLLTVYELSQILI